MNVRITNVEITNYRSCRRTHLNPQQNLSVLIGPNGSGKTNILNALTLLHKLSEYDRHAPLEDEKPTGQCQLKVQFEFQRKNITLTAIIDTYTDENNSDVIIRARQIWNISAITSKSDWKNFPISQMRFIAGGSKQYIPYRLRYVRDVRYLRRTETTQLPKLLVAAFGAIYQYVDNIKYYGASQFTNPSSYPASFQTEEEGSRSIGLRLRNRTRILFDLYEAHKSRKKRDYNFFKDLVGPLGIHIIDDIDFKEILVSSSEYSVRSGGKVRQRRRKQNLIIPQFKIGRQTLTINQLSEGTFKTLALLFYLTHDKSSLLLIEEPEVCVHHGLLSSIIDVIKTHSKNKQIIMSTHSDFVLDKVNPENIYIVKMTPKNGTTVEHVVTSIRGKELNALREYLRTEGNIGEYWRHGRLE